MARGYRPTKRTHPGIYKEMNRMEAEANEIVASVGDALSRITGYNEDDAEIYENAARDRFAARDVKKAIKNFEKAANIYDKVSEDYAKEDRKAYEKYHEKSLDCHRQADRLKRVLKGRWHGLEGKAAAVIGIGGILLGLFFLSPNITGNVIAGASVKSTSFIGAALFIIGLIAIFIGIKKQ